MIINSYYTGKLLQFGIVKQLREMLPSVIYSLIMGGIVYFTILFLPTMFTKLLVGTIVGIFFYILMSVFTRSSDLNYLIVLVREKLSK